MALVLHDPPQRAERVFNGLGRAGAPRQERRRTEAESARRSPPTPYLFCFGDPMAATVQGSRCQAGTTSWQAGPRPGPQGVRASAWAQHGRGHLRHHHPRDPGAPSSGTELTTWTCWADKVISA